MLPKSARLGIANDTFLRGQFPDAGVGPYALIADVGRLTGLGSFVPETAETYHGVSVVSRSSRSEHCTSSVVLI